MTLEFVNELNGMKGVIRGIQNQFDLYDEE